MDIEQREKYKAVIDGIVKGEQVSSAIAELIEIKERETLIKHGLDPDFRSVVPPHSEE
jgi:hypothetical protein